MTDPVYRTFLLFDIEQFGSRNDVEQAYLRRVLYDVADATTLVAASVDEAGRLRADRGDPVMELIGNRVSVPALRSASRRPSGSWRTWNARTEPPPGASSRTAASSATRGCQPSPCSSPSSWSSSPAYTAPPRDVGSRGGESQYEDDTGARN